MAARARAAWNDADFRELAPRLTRTLLFAHTRSATGTPVQRLNCHPFRHGNWLWMHSGIIRTFSQVKRDLVLAVDPWSVPRHRRLDQTPKRRSTWL